MKIVIKINGKPTKPKITTPPPLKTIGGTLKTNAIPKGPNCQEASAALGEYQSLLFKGETGERPRPKLSSCEGPARL